MKIPALRAKIGDRTYYITTLSFQQVAEFVSPIDDQLHKSSSLKDLIQRSITKNYISIKDYILHQPERFFNSLVLAVYENYPDWKEIEFKYDNEETYQMGLLEFPGGHKIFPVDGQHRVEGIKAALRQDSNLASERIGAIFVGHTNSDEGMQKTRRLFTTLNRYAKPVTLDDIIALDEDDSVAIITRYNLEEYDLFSGNRIIYAKQKAIPKTNKSAITSIITLYQANFEIFKIFFSEKQNKKPTSKVLFEFLKFRPVDELLDEYLEFTLTFWDAFKAKLTNISTYMQNDNNPAESFRNNTTGGNLIFRPIGFLPLVKAAITIYSREQISFESIFERFNLINMEMNSTPWEYVLWNPIDRKMIMSSDSITYLLLIYLYDKNILYASELKKLQEGYASKTAYQGSDLNLVLDGIDQN